MLAAAERLGRVAAASFVPRMQTPPLIFSASAPRLMAKKAAKGKEPSSAAQAAAPQGDATVVNGLNILKDGSEIQLRPDSEYPDWVWQLHIPQPSLNELQTKADTDGLDSLSPILQRRLIRQWNRARIKERNRLNSKKG